MKICPKCGRSHNATKYETCSECTDYVAHCRAKQTRQQRYDQYYKEKYGNMERYLKSRVRSSIHEDRDKDRSNNIDYPYIKSLYDEQSGRCKISDVLLTHDQSLNAASIDRIDNSVGHIKGNVQLITVGLNLAKNKHNDNELSHFVGIVRGLSHLVVNDKFVSRNFIGALIGNERLRHVELDFDTDYILGLWEKQKGRCAITGIPMIVNDKIRSIFSVSIDVIDYSKGCVKDNVRLVLRAINLARGKRGDDELSLWLTSIGAIQSNDDRDLLSMMTVRYTPDARDFLTKDYILQCITNNMSYGDIKKDIETKYGIKTYNSYIRHYVKKFENE